MMNMWTGVVEDRQDPLMLGRCRVRIFGVHGKNIQDIPTNDLPWAMPVMPLTSASISGIGDSPVGPVEGTHVVGFWSDGDSMQKPIMIGTLPGIPENTSDTSNPSTAGLQSPLENYPKDTERHGINESDTTRLARYRYPVEGEDGLISGEGVCEECKAETIVKKKLDERVLNVAVANDHGHYSEPPTKFNSKYPFNHVRVSESGHVFEVDDTPQSERLHTYHSSGTFEEIYPFGTKVTKVVRDNYEFVLGDEYINIKKTDSGGGNLYVNIEGDVFEKVDGNVERQINGSVREVIGGNFHTHVNGDRTITTEGSKAEKTAGDVSTEQYNKVEHCQGKCWNNIDGEYQVSSNKSITMRSSGGNISIDAFGHPLGNIGIAGSKSGNVNINSTGFIQQTAGTKVGLTSKLGSVDVNASSGAFSVAALRGINMISTIGGVQINSGTSFKVITGGLIHFGTPTLMSCRVGSLLANVDTSTTIFSPSMLMNGNSLNVFYKSALLTGTGINIHYTNSKMFGNVMDCTLNKFSMKAPSQTYRGIIRMN
tara:strand:+ start:2027 stop:3643 length:1617 start_codon:yes stop_codon:yes gene_type:complete